MVDGRQDGESLLKKVAGLGLTADNLSNLIEQGFIAALDTAAAPAISFTDLPEAATAAVPQAASGEEIDPVAQFQAVHAFYNQTIRGTIGFRGVGLQLKVEKANSIDDLRALRRPFLETVLKLRGVELTRSLRDRLDQLLGGEPEFMVLPDDY